MGFKIKFHKFAGNRRNHTRLFLFIDGLGDSTIAIQQIAMETCSNAYEVFEDIVELPENHPARHYLWQQYGYAYIQKMEEEAESSEKVRKYLNFAAFFDGKGKPAPDEKPSGYLNADDTRCSMGIKLAKILDAPWMEWKIDLTQMLGVFFTTEMNQTRWDQCRAAQSVARHKKEAVRTYQEAVKKLNPYLDKLEQAIDAYDQTVQKWTDQKNGGQQYLEVLAALNMVERVTDIYSEQDKKVMELNSLSKELMNYGGEAFQKALWTAVQKPLAKLKQLYYDSGLNDALASYLQLWDPSHHYYFHTAAANAVGAPKEKEGHSNRFDQRLFAAVGRINQYLSQDPDTATKAAREANTVIPAVWKAVVEKSNTKSPRQLQGPAGNWKKLRQQATELHNTLNSQQPDAGLLTTFAVWSGYICTFTGNFEGPPSILSLILDRYSKSRHFVDTLDRDTLLKAFVMIGVDKAERREIFNKLSTGRVDVARDLFKNGSWRSPTVYCIYSILGVAILVHHTAQLAERYNSGEDIDLIEDEIVKHIAVVVQDLANLALTGVTISYSVQLNRFLRENVNATASQLAARIHFLETATWRVAAVKCLHGTMATIGLGLSVWDTHDNWHKSDSMEKFILAGTMASSFACVLGVLGVTSWLGPAGFVVGVILGLLLVAYQSWFKSEMETTVRTILDAFEKSLFYKKMKNRTLRIETFFIIFENKITCEDIYQDLSEGVAMLEWVDGDELWHKHAVRYLRAGIPAEQLAEIYDLKPKVMKNMLYKQRKDEARQLKANRQISIELLRPGSPKTPLYLGALSELQFALYNHPSVRYIWLTWSGSGDADQYLAPYLDAEDKEINAYDTERQALILRRSKRSRQVQYFKGAFKLQEMPDNGVATFKLQVPDDKNQRWKPGAPAPPAILVKMLSFPVKQTMDPS